jgi:cytochrome c2
MKRAIAIMAALLAMVVAVACVESSAEQARETTGADPQSGRNKIAYYGCGSCHDIPGIQGAHGLVGPPLSRIASRVYLGGVLPNTPENMVQWIRNPKAVDEKTAMPVLNVTETDARDIAAYLYTLK